VKAFFVHVFRGMGYDDAAAGADTYADAADDIDDYGGYFPLR
jgi:hypothetical protein